VPVKPQPYDLGDEITIEARFANAADVLTDPAAVQVQLRCPDGAVINWTTGQLTHPGTGIYQRVYVIANGAGRYRVTSPAVGGVTIVGRNSFQVRDPD